MFRVLFTATDISFLWLLRWRNTQSRQRKNLVRILSSSSMLLKLITTDINRLIFYKLLYRVFYCALSFHSQVEELMLCSEIQETSRKNGSKEAKPRHWAYLVDKFWKWKMNLEEGEEEKNYEEKVLESVHARKCSKFIIIKLKCWSMYAEWRGFSTRIHVMSPQCQRNMNMASFKLI